MQIEKRLGTVETNDRYAHIDAVEGVLKLYSVQLGGNGFIDFYWERHVNFRESRELAGYSDHGNPYYRTRRERHVSYSGHAVAVRLVRHQPNQKDKGRNDHDGASRKESGRSSNNRSGTYETAAQRKKRFCDVLGLPVVFNNDQIKKAYRARMAEYHPDRVHGLGV